LGGICERHGRTAIRAWIDEQGKQAEVASQPIPIRVDWEDVKERGSDIVLDGRERVSPSEIAPDVRGSDWVLEIHSWKTGES